MNKIKLGTFVQDPVTGVTGYAVNRATFLFGCERICVQPRMKEDGTIPESIMVDEPQLIEPTQNEYPPLQCLNPPPIRVTLGNIVKDPLNGVESTVTGRAVYLNGCARVYLEPVKKLLSSNNEECYWVDEPQVIDTHRTLLTKNTGDIEQSRKTGGPARSNSNY